MGIGSAVLIGEGVVDGTGSRHGGFSQLQRAEVFCRVVGITHRNGPGASVRFGAHGLYRARHGDDGIVHTVRLQLFDGTVGGTSAGDTVKGDLGLFRQDHRIGSAVRIVICHDPVEVDGFAKSLQFLLGGVVIVPAVETPDFHERIDRDVKFSVCHGVCRFGRVVHVNKLTGNHDFLAFRRIDTGNAAGFVGSIQLCIQCIDDIRSIADPLTGVGSVCGDLDHGIQRGNGCLIGVLSTAGKTHQHCCAQDAQYRCFGFSKSSHNDLHVSLLNQV